MSAESKQVPEFRVEYLKKNITRTYLYGFCLSRTVSRRNGRARAGQEITRLFDFVEDMKEETTRKKRHDKTKKKDIKERRKQGVGGRIIGRGRRLPAGRWSGARRPGPRPPRPVRGACAGRARVSGAPCQQAGRSAALTARSHFIICTRCLSPFRSAFPDASMARAHFHPPPHRWLQYSNFCIREGGVGEGNRTPDGSASPTTSTH